MAAWRCRFSSLTSQSSVSNDYVLNGYEASFATYDVNEAGEDHHSPRRGLDHARARRTEPDARLPLRRRAPGHAVSPTGGTLVGHVGALLTSASPHRSIDDEDTHTWHEWPLGLGARARLHGHELVCTTRSRIGRR